MTKHPLLPDNYKDSITHAAILSALKPYETAGSGNVNNPQGRWNLHKAWDKAEELLPHTHWKYIESLAFDPETAEYVFSAYNEHEAEQMNTLIAGMVAYQILNESEDTALQRIEHKKGGEADLVISHAVAESLKAMFPDLTLIGGPYEEKKPDAAVSPAIKSIFRFFRFGKK